MGARSFDIRGNATKDDASAADVKIIHGGDTWQCQEKDGSDLTLQSIFNTSLAFLEKHPSETIILTIKPDDGSTVGMEHAVAEFVKNHQDKAAKASDLLHGFHQLVIPFVDKSILALHRKDHIRN